MKGLKPSTIFQALVTHQVVLGVIFAHQEHRVHNIVLYPDKNSWCKTLEIKQIISHPGYKSEEIDNNVCVGACFSYSIPHTEPSDPGEVIVPYCDSCQPSETYWKHITLQSEKENDVFGSTLLKRVQIITNCSCTSCKKNNGGQGYDDWLRSIDENDDHDVLDSNDVPDLIDVVNNRNTNTSHHHIPNANTDNIRKLLDHKLIDLLKNIQENNSKPDKLQLIELLKMLKTSDHKISNKNIEEFVETLNEDNIEMDLSKLKEILLKYDREIGDHENLNHHQTHPHPHPHQHHQQHHGRDENHNHHNSNENHHHKNPHLHNMHHHHHHVGDIIEGHGHLERGPHGALVINPVDNTIHEKVLDVNPQELKPNHAGTMLSYSSHSEDKPSHDDD